MVNEPSSSPIKAGEALMRAIEDDPAQQAKVEAVRRHNKQKWQDLAGDLDENMESARDLVEALFGFRPKTIEDWEDLAGIVKMPFENLRSGDLTLQEIYDAVGHWAIEVVARKRLEMEEEKGGVYTPAAGDQERKPARPNEAVECYVTLLQMAAISSKGKRTLVRLRDAGKLPPPDVKGGKGKANEWRWSEVRPILESEYARQMPKVFPADRFVRH